MEHGIGIGGRTGGHATTADTCRVHGPGRKCRAPVTIVMGMQGLSLRCHAHPLSGRLPHGRSHRSPSDATRPPVCAPSSLVEGCHGLCVLRDDRHRSGRVPLHQPRLRGPHVAHAPWMTASDQRDTSTCLGEGSLFTPPGEHACEVPDAPQALHAAHDACAYTHCAVAAWRAMRLVNACVRNERCQLQANAVVHAQ